MLVVFLNYAVCSGCGMVSCRVRTPPQHTHEHRQVEQCSRGVNAGQVRNIRQVASSCRLVSARTWSVPRPPRWPLVPAKHDMHPLKYTREARVVFLLSQTHVQRIECAFPIRAKIIYFLRCLEDRHVNPLPGSICPGRLFFGECGEKTRRKKKRERSALG